MANPIDQREICWTELGGPPVISPSTPYPPHTSDPKEPSEECWYPLLGVVEQTAQTWLKLESEMKIWGSQHRTGD